MGYILLLCYSISLPSGCLALAYLVSHRYLTQFCAFPSYLYPPCIVDSEGVSSNTRNQVCYYMVPLILVFSLTNLVLQAVRRNVIMYQIRSASSTSRESLLTNPRTEAAYLDALQNTSSNAALDLWRSILIQEFPSSNVGDSFIISSIDPSEIKALVGGDVSVAVSLRASLKAEHDSRVLLALGFEGKDKDTTDERELLVVRFVTWSKKETKKDSGIRYLFGLLVVGIHARLLKYDKHEGALEPFHGDEWLDARSGKWRGIIENMKEAIAEGVAAM
ncbi:hypothetical protein BGX38DRAFT_166285 [Terfezia claveryi]|nr:hypothetical protein BGX38DRAFT_166285 [Terfezia claveryi]